MVGCRVSVCVWKGGLGIGLEFGVWGYGLGLGVSCDVECNATVLAHSTSD